MEQLTDLKAILHSKRANIYYLEKCRVMQKDGRVLYLTEAKDQNYYWNIPIANLIGNRYLNNACRHAHPSNQQNGRQTFCAHNHTNNHRKGNYLMAQEKLIATIPPYNEAKNNAKNLECRKETVARYFSIAKLKTALDGDFMTVIDARFYMGRAYGASVVYCSVWINCYGYTTSGHGQAGGYDYDKISAALGDALASAGVVLNRSIKGSGQTREALEAITEALGYKDFTVIG